MPQLKAVWCERPCRCDRRPDRTDIVIVAVGVCFVAMLWAASNGFDSGVRAHAEGRYVVVDGRVVKSGEGGSNR